MWYIIIGIIILGVIASIFEYLSELVGGTQRLIIIIVVLVAAFLAFSWVGVFAIVVLAVAIRLLSSVGREIKSVIEKHDEESNDKILMKELEKNCKWLGEMNSEKWKEKLPNYVGRKYSTSFEEITENFARQLEQQNILQSDEWFEPYKRYVVEHDGGATVTKMLNEVNCPQLQITHITQNGDLINTLLMRGTKKKSEDVPALFDKTFINEMNEYLYKPTRYLLKLYNRDCSSYQAVHREEIDFDNL